MLNIQETLSNAIGTAELVNIIYHGGSEPGAARMIMPLQIKGDRIRARCYKTNTVKEFSLDKIALATDDVVGYTGKQNDVDYEPASLMEVANLYIGELKSLGWDVMQYDQQVSLYSFFKNGNRKKSPDLSICYGDGYVEGTKILSWVNDGYIDPRPWKVHGASFKYLGKAFNKFLQIAREKAPAKGA